LTTPARSSRNSGKRGNDSASAPQDPLKPGADKGPSTFDVRHVFSLSLFQNLPFDRVHFLERLGKRFTSGWQLLNVTTLTSGSPFTVFLEFSKRALGLNGADRPDLVSMRIFPRAALCARTTSDAVQTTLLSFHSHRHSRGSGPIRVGLARLAATLSVARRFINWILH